MVDQRVVSRYTETKSGYVKLYLSNGKVVEEHRYVMANLLRRELGPDEAVHHKDENKQNNDPSNLEILTRSEHASHHAKKGETMIAMVCAHCGSSFSREARNIRFKALSGQTKFYCRRKCVGSAIGRGVRQVD